MQIKELQGRIDSGDGCKSSYFCLEKNFALYKSSYIFGFPFRTLVHRISLWYRKSPRFEIKKMWQCW